MAKLFIQILDRFAPRVGANLRCFRYRRALWPIFRYLATENGGKVAAGPFRGMAYASSSITSEQVFHYSAVPKMLGCYEEELHDIVEEAVMTGYDTIINVGCAEGYYVAGLARRLPRAKIFAFDIDPAARRLCEERVCMNGVQSRVTILGECTPDKFDCLASGRTLIVCDCEGAEIELLRPDLAPTLRRCDVLVELHPHVHSAVSTEIPARFRGTHSYAMIRGTPRNPSAFPAIERFGAYRQKLAVSEFREDIGEWAFFVSRSSGDSGDF